MGYLIPSPWKRSGGPFLRLCGGAERSCPRLFQNSGGTRQKRPRKKRPGAGVPQRAGPRGQRPPQGPRTRPPKRPGRARAAAPEASGPATWGRTPEGGPPSPRGRPAAGPQPQEQRDTTNSQTGEAKAAARRARKIGAGARAPPTQRGAPPLAAKRDSEGPAKRTRRAAAKRASPARSECPRPQ